MLDLERLENSFNIIDALEPLEPIPFGTETIPTPWPSDCLPDTLAQAVEAIAMEVQAPVPLAAFAVVSAISHLAMRLTDANHPKMGAMPCSLYLLSQAPSGDRKSACFKLATYPIQKLEREAREAHKKDAEQIWRDADAAKGKAERAEILAQLAPDPRTIYTDGTIQKIESDFVNGSAPALSFSTDEGSSLLAGHSLKSDTRAASLGGLTRLFDGEGVQRDRVLEGQSGFRYGVRFGLFLSAQPVVLQSTLSDPMLRGQGFLARFLFSAPRSLAGTRFLDPSRLHSKASDRVEIRAYWDALRSMASAPVSVEDGSLRLDVIAMAPAAQMGWLEFFNDTERRQGQDGDLQHLGAFASRAGELAARLAAVFAAYRHYGERCDMGLAVTQDDMQRACRLVGYSLNEWQAQANSSNLSQREIDAKQLLDVLHGKAWTDTTRQLIAQNAPNKLRKDKDRRNAAIDELLERRWLKPMGTGFAIVKKPISTVATATTATTATYQASLAHKSSKSSESSSSNSQIPFYASNLEREEL